MARIRTIKPDFWTDEKVVELDFVERLLFIGMWNFADDQGYLDLSLKRIKMQIFPGDDVDVSRGLTRLHEMGLIRLYRAPEGSLVLHLINWAKHQRISNPSLARFTQGDLQECGWNDTGLASPLEPSVVLGKGREGKGRELSSDSEDDEPDLFADFYAAYPRKEAKRAAEKAWRAATKRADPSVIMAGLERFPFSADRQFIPLPASWLNAERWADENATVHQLNGAYTADELNTILGPPPPLPQPPRDLTAEQMWEWEQRTRQDQRADRVRQANAKLGRPA